MNYRTKIPIPLFSIVIPVGSEILPYKNGDYYYELNGSKYFFSEYLVHVNPDIFEPERTWTDEEMIEFKFHHLFIEQGGSTLISGIGYEKEYLNRFAKLKGK